MLVIITIFFASIIAVALFSILGFSFYLKKRTKFIHSENQRQFDEPPVYRSLFEPSDAEMRAFETEEQAKQRETKRWEILAKAEANDFIALLEARDFEIQLYDEVLSKLIFRADIDENFASLVSFIDENDLQANAEAVRRFEKIWRKSFSRKGTIELLHLAAKTRKAEVFSETLETVLQQRREGFLPQITSENLKHLAESEFWLLPSEERNSGAGFLLKRKLSDLDGEN